MTSRILRFLRRGGCWLACNLIAGAQLPVAAQVSAGIQASPAIQAAPAEQATPGEQTTPAEQATPPSYTLHVGTRLVLTDVTVTDQHGNVVQGLDRSAFHIFDNGKPQQITSFTEHTASENPSPGPRPVAGEIGNGFLQHAPPAFNALLIDITTIGFTDQAYLANQLQQFLSTLQPNDTLAVYTRAGDAVVELQGFTSDPELLRAAIRKAVPKLQQPGSWAATDLGTLEQMLTLLKPYPGRKNLIWFSGGSNLALLADATGFPSFVDMRRLYDELESSRIAVFPVDARGLTVGSSGGMMWQHMMMDDTAEATGGHAFYNSNGLKQIATRIVGSGSDFYTLSYSPPQPNFDNRWHRVKVVAGAGAGSYQLSYRHGYFNDTTHAVPASGDRTILQARGMTQQQSSETLRAPLIFSVAVSPAATAVAALQQPSDTPKGDPPKRNQSTYNVHYTLPIADLVRQNVDGKEQVSVGIGVLAVNRLGAHLAQQTKAVQVSIDPEKLHAHPDGRIAFDDQINLPRGEQFLYILAWDQRSGRFGTVQTPLTVPKP